MGICVCAPGQHCGCAVSHGSACVPEDHAVYVCGRYFCNDRAFGDQQHARSGAAHAPVTMTCFAIASLGIAGLPLMAGFVSKFNLIRGILAMGQPFFAVVLVAGGAAGAELSAACGAACVRKGCGRGRRPLLPAADAHGHTYPVQGDAALAMRIPLMLTTMVAVLLGCMPNAGPKLYALAQMAAAAVTEGGGGLAG